MVTRLVILRLNRNSREIGGGFRQLGLAALAAIPKILREALSFSG